QHEYRRLLRDQMSQLEPDPAASLVRLQALIAIMRDILVERRDNPRNDLISALWSTTIDGEPMRMDDIENFAIFLFIAGLDTVVNGISFGVRHLANDPQLQERLRRDPALVPAAAEELLRRYTFVTAQRR